MSIVFRLTPDQRAVLVLEGEPDYCHVLATAPNEREPELNEGRWLILLYAAWSGPDRRAITVALSVVQEFHGDVQLGIRQFSDHDEFRKLHPKVKERWRSPVWLILEDGRVREELAGFREHGELKVALERAMAQT